VVIVDEVAIVELRQDVPVHHQERAVEPVDEAKRSGRAERLVLVHVLDRDVTVLAIVEDRLDQVGQVAHAKGDVRDSARFELIYHQLQDRPLADRHQRLRQHRGVRSKTSATPAGEHDRFRPPLVLVAVSVRVVAVAVQAVAVDLGAPVRFVAVSPTGHGYLILAGCWTGWPRPASSVRRSGRRRTFMRPVSRFTATARRKKSAATVHAMIWRSIPSERRSA
jgi:hypothetical protein